MITPNSDTEKLYRVLWPDEGWATAADLMRWAHDAVANGKLPDGDYSDADKAANALHEEGLITLKGRP